MINKYIKKFIVLLTVVLAVPLYSIAQTKIVVLTDTHVMGPGLLIKDGTAWQNYLAGDRRLEDYSKDLFDLMITKIKDEIRPDLVFITGDITKDGEILSHDYVVGKLAVLKAAGIPVLVIPGNHDLGTSSAKYYDGDVATNAEVCSSDAFVNYYHDYGYDSDSEFDTNSLSYAREPVDGLVILGIDSGKNGVLSSSTLSWICEKARSAREKGKQIIALMHHPLIPHFDGVEDFVSTAMVNDYETIRNALADAGVRVVLTGHFHTSDIATDRNADLTKSIVDVNTGSLISYPCDYRIMTLSQDMNTLNVTTGSVTEITPGDDFSTTAKNRLKQAIEDRVKARGTAFSLIAGTVSTAFICHAEGDEHKSPTAASSLSTLLGMASLAKMAGMSSDEVSKMETMGNSMLKDISQYSDATRADQTDDRTVGISLDPVTETVTIPTGGYMTYCSEKNIDFSKTDGLSAYIMTEEDQDCVYLEKVKAVSHGTGIILAGTEGTTYTLHATEEENSPTQLLKGTLQDTTAEEGTYVLSMTESGVAFCPLKKAVTIPAGKAYFITK